MNLHLKRVKFVFCMLRVVTPGEWCAR